MNLNILVLTYIDDLELWKRTTLEFVNQAVNQSNVFVTLFLVQDSDKRYDLDELLDKKVELRTVSIQLKHKTEFPFIEQFFDLRVRNKVMASLEEILIEKIFDVIQLDRIAYLLFLPNIRTLSEGLIIYRQYQAESFQIEASAKQHRFSLFKYFAISKLATKAKELESLASEVDYIISSSFQQLSLNKSVNIFLLPNELPNRPKALSELEKFKLLFVGNLKLVEIQQAILWFLNETWETLRSKIPEIELHIIGQSEPWYVSLLERWPKVFYYPQVEDFETFAQDKLILLLPYEKAFGLMPEYIQAMQMGKIIVAHTEAVCCWGLTSMIHYMPAKESVKFVEVLEHLHTKLEIRKYFSEQMANFANQSIDQSYLTKVVLRLYIKILTQKQH